MRPMRVGDVELCFEEYGDPGHPSVLLVAGAAAPMDWWDAHFCEAIAARGRHVVRYDHRDTGRSTTGPVGPPPYGGRALEQDCEALAEGLARGPVHLVGMSMGGGIAQAVALRRPDLVGALTLIATSAVGGVDHGALPGPEPRVQAAFDDPPPDPDWNDREQVVAWLVAAERTFSGPLFDEERALAIARSVVDRSIDPAAAGNHWLVLGGEEEDEPLDVRRIACPTLVLHGTDDPLFPLRHGEVLAASIPGARLLVVEGMGHQLPPLASWGEVVPAILAISE